MRLIVLAALLLTVATCALCQRPYYPPWRRYYYDDRIRLPSGAEYIIGEVRSGFSCHGLNYGYYADDFNDCQIFHVCVPASGDSTNTQMRRFSFMCGNQTLFNQKDLTCEHNSRVDCQESRNYYWVNNRFYEDAQTRSWHPYARTQPPVNPYKADQPQPYRYNPYSG